ncbi:MAG TPA: alcohol dehydrogenase catalytic domain-containing protein, partial [Candidatus Saccharimonadales bacterium]|nr:alcohol dehydrogenase catalytic domain-containing protein [Candidatus Saccharimonadales bacterium]
MVLHERGPAGPGRLRMEEIADPVPGPGEIRIRVTVCAVCRTDLHVIEGDLPEEKIPVIPGHQVVGVVDALGEGAGSFTIGDRAGIAWLRSTCGTCTFCRSGRENLCAAARFTGYHENGGYAGSAVVPAAFAYRIPPAFADADAAPLLCAGIIGYRALRRSDVPAGGRL